MNSEIIEKLRKMLNLSKSANQKEAELAMQKAVALAAKYEIDLAIINLNNPKVEKEEMIRSNKSMGQRFPVTQEYVSRILLDFFNVKIVYTGSREVGRSIVFLGAKSDVQFALYIQDFLNEHMMRSWQYYQKTRNVETAYRATFFYSFQEALSAKLARAKNEEVNNTIAAVESFKQSDVKNSYALVIQDKKKDLEDFQSKIFPDLRRATKVKKSIYLGSEAAIIGARYGEATNINRPIGN